MKKIIFLFVLLLVTTPIYCQVNLVRNPSFEQHDTCPDFYDQVRKALFWDGIDTNYVYGDAAYYAGYQNCLPDYMNVCDTYGLCRIPNNPYFYHYPRTGTGMMENIMYYDLAYINTTGVRWLNYTQGRLFRRLVAGKTYCVTFYVLQERWSQYSVNKIGAYLDDGTIDTVSSFLGAATPQTQYTPQILDTNVISDTTNWTKIQGSFTANGTEKFITIGVFFDTAHTTHISNTNSTRVGMYLIDDVSVIASDAVAYAGEDTLSMHPGDTVRLGLSDGRDGMPCYWYKLGVTAPIDSGGTILVHPDSSTTYVVVMDICGQVTFDTVKVWVYPDTPASVGNLQLAVSNVQVYPNPVKDELTISGIATNCHYSLVSVTGVNLQEGNLSHSSTSISLKNYPTGIYIVSITGMDGQRKMFRVVKE